MNLKGILFKDKTKFFFLYFLPDEVAALISVVLMFGVTVGDHYLNICMIDNYVPYVANLAKYSMWTAFGSYVFFFIGVFFKKIVFEQLFATIFTVYIFISGCFFYYNFASIIFSWTYHTAYNVFDYLTELYLYDHKELDWDENYNRLRSEKKTKLWLCMIAHIVVLLVMIYYNIILTEYMEKKKLEFSGELGENNLYEKSKFQGNIKSSNITINDNDNVISKSNKDSQNQLVNQQMNINDHDLNETNHQKDRKSVV